MATYTDDLALIIRYDGTKSAFDAVKANYVNKVVFITGTTDDPHQAIYVSDNTGGKYLDMSDINLVEQELAHLNLVSDGTTYKDWNGGKGIAFKGQNGIKITIEEKTYNVDGVATPFFDIIYDTSELQTDINTLLDSTAKIGDDGKILESQLPDYILGQLLFGGTLDDGTETKMTVTPTANLLNKIGKTDADLTNGKLDITNTSFETYEGVYFISSLNFGTTNVVNIPDVRTGDWIISTGTSWRKVDNTDAVASVAGLTGTITASDLAKKLAETGDANELALKSEVDAKYTKPNDGIPEGDLAGEVLTKINLGNTSVQNVSGGDFISVTDTSGTTNNKSYEVSAKTKTMESAKTDILLNGEDALATAHDVYNFINARLSVKVV